MNVSCATVLCALVCVGTLASANQISLASICAYQSVEITTRSQIRSLAEEMKSTGGADCPRIIREILPQLNDMVNGEHATCSPAHVDRIKAFFHRYVVPWKTHRWYFKKKMPIAMRRAAVLYAIKVNDICKSNMAKLLPKASQEFVGPDDFASLSKITENELIKSMMSDPKEYNNILTPILFPDYLADIGYNFNEEVHVQSARAKILSRVQQICATRFQPIYEQLVLPAISLSNLGLNYNGDQFEAELQKKGDAETVHLWYRIVFMCEAIKPIVPIEGENDKVLRFLKKEQAVGKEIAVDDSIHLEMNKYEPDSIDNMDDLIINSSNDNADLMKFVDNFKKHKRHINNLRANVIIRYAKFVLMKMKEFGWKLFDSRFDLKKKKEDEKEKEEDVTDKAVEGLDHLTNQLEQEETGLMHLEGNIIGDVVVFAGTTIVTLILIISAAM